MEHSFYRNWHRPSAWYRATKKKLCNTWWPKAQRLNNTMIEITFTADEPNQQISFTLTKEQAEHLNNQLSLKLTTL